MEPGRGSWCGSIDMSRPGCSLIRKWSGLSVAGRWRRIVRALACIGYQSPVACACHGVVDQKDVFSPTARGCNCSIVGDPDTKQAVVIDPGGAPGHSPGSAAAGIHGQPHPAYSRPLRSLSGVQQGQAGDRCHDLPSWDDLQLWENLELQCRMFGASNAPALSPDYWLVDEEKVMLGQVPIVALHAAGNAPLGR